MSRLVFVAAVAVASWSFAQVVVTGKDGKAVKVGAGTVQVKKGSKTVNVNTGAAGVQVEAANAGGDATVVLPSDNAAAGASGGVFQVTGQGRTETHACAPNEDVEVTGQSNVLTFTGPCRTVRVTGQSNTVTLEQVADLQVSGMSNTATWKQGPDGKKPKVSVGGMGNSATAAKP